MHQGPKLVVLRQHTNKLLSNISSVCKDKTWKYFQPHTGKTTSGKFVFHKYLVSRYKKLRTHLFFVIVFLEDEQNIYCGKIISFQTI